jgi:hypothetical protein
MRRQRQHTPAAFGNSSPPRVLFVGGGVVGVCLLLLLIVPTYHSFHLVVVPTLVGSRRSCRSCIVLYEKSSQQQQPYRFGDLTRGLVNRSRRSVNELTSKDDYEFGDLSKYVDERIKRRIVSARKTTTTPTTNGYGSDDDSNNNSSATPTASDYNYRFGDVTLWVDDYIKEQASKFVRGPYGTTTTTTRGGDDPTTKTYTQDYRFGDISRRIVQLIRQQQETLSEEQLADVYLALRYLVSAGIMITPLLSLLPFRGVVALLNFGLQERVSTRVLEVVATAVEARIQKALDNSSSSSTTTPPRSGATKNTITAKTITNAVVGNERTRERLLRTVQHFTTGTTSPKQDSNKNVFGDMTRAVQN